ncbi:MAG: hypothetical protein JKY13_03920 [Gammaproteobacteria bacterium]|nr:hypothetical protein [Gammaproteobacteria bacterium]
MMLHRLIMAKKIRIYLENRQKDKKSKETQAALLELQLALDLAERVVRKRLWKVDAGKLELSMEWFKLFRANVDAEVLKDRGSDFADLAELVVKYNRTVKTGDDIEGNFAAVDEMEEAFKNAIMSPSIALISGKFRDALRIALFSFATQDLRLARMNLLAAYRLGEDSAFRVDGPLERVDLHHDFYSDGETLEQGQRNAVMPKGLKKAELTLADSMDKDKNPLGKNEGITAVALQRTYPQLFSKIKRAERREDDLGITHDVEYFDDLGNPWDQKAPRSYSKDGNPIGDWIKSITKQLGKQFPKEGTGGEYDKSGRNPTQMIDIGVVLDTSYLTQNDYVRLWSGLIQANVAVDRIIEINSPYDVADVSKRAASVAKGGDKSNTTMLDGARTKAAPHGGIHEVSAAGLGLAEQLAAIRKNPQHASLNNAHSIYRNHGNPLPNQGSYFIEYYVMGGSFDSGAEMRIVWDKPNDIFYITGTHYHFWMSPYDDDIRNPFYRLGK